MEYAFTTCLEERFHEEIRHAVTRFIRSDNIREIPVRVIHAGIHWIDTDDLAQFEDHVNLHAVLSADILSNEDGRRYHRTALLHAQLSGTFSRLFDDFSIVCTGMCRTLPQRRDRTFTEDLLFRNPETASDDAAVKLLERVYGYLYVHRRPTRIDPVYMARKLGLHLYAAHMPGTLPGEYSYLNSVGTFCSPRSEQCYRRELHGRSAVIAPEIAEIPERLRLAAMHMLVHDQIQRYAFCLRAMYGRDPHLFPCAARQEDPENGFTVRAEQQADRIAACAMMPKEAFMRKAEELYSRCRAFRTADDVRFVIRQSAAFFGVPAAAARERMLMLGFDGVPAMQAAPFCSGIPFQTSALSRNST